MKTQEQYREAAKKILTREGIIPDVLREKFPGVTVKPEQYGNVHQLDSTTPPGAFVELTMWIPESYVEG